MVYSVDHANFRYQNQEQNLSVVSWYYCLYIFFQIDMITFLYK